ncbi:MAG: NERD domain-containing protein [Methanobrevibacter sp.]|uniref:NERD domain-containing protein n=1 Tax=Methanobrevibacter sp. TaxID=66852 RepID=UPI0025FAAB1A|nr:NERD domain-containing protein [Methanobrevibacter sp.]MBR0271777.1 NERD domain-containing protein [Methanobrevibacter sp.]
MKVVCCKNCGAKYQLDDNDDISSFECSSCAGDLELLEDYSNSQSSSSSGILSSIKYDNSQIVQCEDCGLKYKIKASDNILDYECDSCGGSLRYLDSEMNKELDQYIDERKKELAEIRKNQSETPEIEEQAEDNARSIKSITDKLENFFSEDQMQKIAEEELEEERMQVENNTRTARTTIPEPVLSKFGKEFALPKTNDYNILKEFLKDEFFKGMKVYYQTPEKETKGRLDGILDKISIKEPGDGIVSTDKLNDDGPDFDIKNLNTDQYVIIAGVVIFVLSIIEVVFVNSGIGLAALLIGIVIIAYGLYRTRDTQETTIRTRIIREHLLSLPEDYYVFYNVKTPTSPVGINHVVVGPTGIYALLSQKYNPKNRLNSENENIELIKSAEKDQERFEITNVGNQKLFKYTTKQAKFSQDNAIKQKALTLGEDLINFLNENNIRNCFVEPLVGFINNEVVVINMPLTDEDLFIDELLNTIQTSTIKLNSETIDKCAVLLSKYSADCSSEF